MNDFQSEIKRDLHELHNIADFSGTLILFGAADNVMLGKELNLITLMINNNTQNVCSAIPRWASSTRLLVKFLLAEFYAYDVSGKNVDPL